MSASLVGSEMCIRDRRKAPRKALRKALLRLRIRLCAKLRIRLRLRLRIRPVSYTHLTLPTICSV
eukprot:3624928-Alexandrium_andersonii.AAC.1